MPENKDSFEQGGSLSAGGQRSPIAEEIIRVREEELNGITQKELAEKLGVVPQYVAMWESDHRKVSEKLVGKIAQAGKNKKQRDAIGARLRRALLRTHYPETTAELELMHAEKVAPSDKPYTAAITQLITEVCRSQQVNPKLWVTRTLDCDPRYTDGVFAGKYLLAEHEVTALARAAGEDEEQWRQATGYWPDVTNAIQQEFAARGQPVNRKSAKQLARLLAMLEQTRQAEEGT